MKQVTTIIVILSLSFLTLQGTTTALWLFDEQEGLYPSCTLSDASSDSLHLIYGRGGRIVPGKFGRALRADKPEPFNPVFNFSESGNRIRFGLEAPEKKPGRTVEPLTWYNNQFAGMFTNGDHFEAPDLGAGRGNQVIPGPARRGSIFIDPNGPAEERWKALVGLHDRGGWYIWTSPDGWSFKRSEVAALPFWPGSASTIFYDEQRQVYVAHHRSDYGSTPGGQTERYFVSTEVKDLFGSWAFEPTTREKALAVHKVRPIQVNKLDPWWLDNGPLAPPGFGIEFPIVMGRDPEIDPVATDIYNTRAMKYPWAEDAYVAFPLWFFHYHGDGPPARQVLADEERGLGTGMVEPQLTVSRDGVNWKRYPRPAYIPVGDHKGFPVK